MPHLIRVKLCIGGPVVTFPLQVLYGRSINMMSMRTLGLAAGLAAVLATGVAGSGFAATGNDGAGQGVTTSPASPTMSSPNKLSHDGNNQLGPSNRRGMTGRTTDHPGAAASPHTGFSSGMTPNAGTASGTMDGTTDTGATSPGSGQLRR
jgi:hypothetical protein